ncbi:MarR family winged helix-turn-helix transcriptional regulator [Serpentinicella alkaliphila]|uniref:MarR family transcriptional regulator n=1 Tax=Serpentinicella alkaliphila TaxID=1734049 RepID=A0A4R2UCR9_9FIRM|nr:MarR family transcriptional regulator [Serpentinicella alkaliphila]QUH26842.1 MarR family transcriptional regulator [Serpentinicella alkaliphila]TCQ08069.1 MarR family transcriptional regulator [Serpentinicella alkaliphila]
MNKYDKIKLQNQICFPLYALSREVIKKYKPLLDKFNLTYTQYVTMLVIWEEEKIMFKELAKRLHLDSGTLTPVVKKLEAMGLIIKYRNKDDDRNVTIEVTNKGLLLKDEILEVPEKIYCNYKGDEEKLILLKQLLDQLLLNTPNE